MAHNFTMQGYMLNYTSVAEMRLDYRHKTTGDSRGAVIQRHSGTFCFPKPGVYELIHEDACFKFEGHPIGRFTYDTSKPYNVSFTPIMYRLQGELRFSSEKDVDKSD